jgi:hypothetical protein
MEMVPEQYSHLYNEAVVCEDFVTFCGACGVNIRILKERDFSSTY